MAQRAAYESAEIVISADSGCSLYYTLNGTEPTAENTAINANTLRLEPTKDDDVTLKVIAVKGNKQSEVATVTIPFRREREVNLQADWEAACYNSDDRVAVSAVSDGTVLYTLDYLDGQNNGILRDVVREGEAADGKIKLPFADYPEGGTLVLQAVAVADGEAASPIARLDFAFAASNADAFVVGGKTFATLAEAAAALTEEDAVIYLQDDVTLGSDVLFPNQAITLASTGSAVQYTFKADSVQLQEAVTFRNLRYDIGNLYANGHNVTIEADVTAPFAILSHRIFAGCAYGDLGIQLFSAGKLANTTLMLQGSGYYTVYGGGAVGTSWDGDVNITTVNGNGKAARAIWGSTMNGTVTLNGKTLTDNTQVQLGGAD